MKRFLKIVVIIIAVLIVIAIAVPFFIDANTFRPKLESELTDTLGREVKVGNLSLSLFSGSVAADNISIADDPKFSHTPFVQAKSLKVGVEMLPLIFHRTLNVTNLTLNQPEISLVKSANGQVWNFSSIGQKPGTSTAAPEAPPAPETPSKTEAQKKAAAPSSRTGTAAHPEPAGAKPGASNAETAQTTPSSSSSASSTPSLSVAKLNINDGRLTVSRADSTEKQRVYDKVNVQVTNFSFTSSFPVEVTANTPSGGTMKLTGNAGPIDATNAALTPVNAKLSVQNMNLATSGFIDPAMGLGGIADLDATVVSDGHHAKVAGTAKASNLQVSQKGKPAGRPVDVNFATVYDLVKQTGDITKCDVAMGKAVAHLTGTFDAHGQVTTVNLKLNGPNMPVDDLEAMLPAFGIVLPPNATLKGGDLNVAMDSTGPVDKLVTTGNVKLENTQLANFNLGQKLAAVSALAGKSTGNDTTIQNLSANAKNSPQGTAVSNLNLTVPSIGILTGDGTVSPSNELAFKMKAAVGGMGIPFGVTGTTSDPKFTPDVKGIATGLMGGILSGQGVPGAQGQNQNQQQNPINSVMGLFKKKQPQK